MAVMLGTMPTLGLVVNDYNGDYNGESSCGAERPGSGALRGFIAQRPLERMVGRRSGGKRDDGCQAPAHFALALRAFRAEYAVRWPPKDGRPAPTAAGNMQRRHGQGDARAHSSCMKDCAASAHSRCGNNSGGTSTRSDRA